MKLKATKQYYRCLITLLGKIQGSFESTIETESNRAEAEEVWHLKLNSLQVQE